MREFWCVTTFFNPGKFRSLLHNYFVFAEHLRRQDVNLLTVELAFNDDEFLIPQNDNVRRLRSNSIMWQKERLINYGVSQLPPECTSFAWLDCDVIFSDDKWQEVAAKKLENNNIIQLFKRVYHLPQGDDYFKGDKLMMCQSIVWQKMIHRNWLHRRRIRELPFSHPGFAWAAQRHYFDDIGGIYDKNIVGSGDTFLVDCYFDSWDIHGYAQKFTPGMKKDMMAWRDGFKKKPLSIDYLPMDIYHLWHGSLKNRKYMDRHDVVLKYNYDPLTDIKLVGDVFEWASDKTGMHNDIRDYFHQRQEDSL